MHAATLVLCSCVTLVVNAVAVTAAFAEAEIESAETNPADILVSYVNDAVSELSELRDVLLSQCSTQALQFGVLEHLHKVKHDAVIAETLQEALQQVLHGVSTWPGPVHTGTADNDFVDAFLNRGLTLASAVRVMSSEHLAAIAERELEDRALLDEHYNGSSCPKKALLRLRRAPDDVRDADDLRIEYEERVEMALRALASIKLRTLQLISRPKSGLPRNILEAVKATLHAGHSD
ncbi:MAG: hypothetical protein MHM6MM_003811 [Cercozoa sp. M6MM]